MSRICLVSCASSKRSERAKAKDLYVSPLFQCARIVAERDFDRWFILSAMHGLLDPEKSIDPYNETLNEKGLEERAKWADRVAKKLLRNLKPGDVVTFLAGEAYREFLISKLLDAGYSYETPLSGLGLGQQIHTLKLLAECRDRLSDLTRFYTMLGRLRDVQGTAPLSSCAGAACLPVRGVYFFFEEAEMRLMSRKDARCVRVGTHAVSKNSSSTLWSRLRTHRGTSELGGNHRSSIFRLHIGAAMLARGDFKSSASWGIGQDAPTEIRTAERIIEQAVSKFVGAMKILWIGVPDDPGARSDRSFIEKNSIGLLAGPDGPFDLPSRKWLGLNSRHEAIRSSGLWNVNYVDVRYDPRFLDAMQIYVDATIGLRDFPAESIAPRDWYKGSESFQMSFL